MKTYLDTSLSTSARLGLSLLASLLLLGVTGCGGTTNPREMDAYSKAKKVKELREEAEYQLGRFIASQADEKGVNREALFSYKDRWKDITDLMGPADFPGAYAQYGVALSQVALFHRTLAQLHEKDLNEETSAQKKAESRQGMEKNQNEALKYFALSNRQFEIYFQASQNQLDGTYYRWAIGNCENLKDWRGALRYLDLVEGSGALNEKGKGEVAQLRKEYSEALRIQEEGDLDRELNKSRKDDARRSSKSDARPEPAN